MKELAAVRLTATAAEIAYGEDLLVCGSAQPLGRWDAASAAPMRWQEGGRWVLEVGLPCGVLVELKVLVRNQGQYRWYGAGAGKDQNVVLETSLGRVGARGSRFVSTEALPFDLQVEDIDGTQEIANEAAGAGAVRVASPVPADVRGGQVALCAAPHAAPPHAAPSSIVAGGPAAAQSPQQEVAAAMLAGAAAHAGHAVTYTTTTTTTTAVTINGAWDPNTGAPPAPCITMAQHVGVQPVGQYAALPAPAPMAALPGPGPPQPCAAGKAAGALPEATPAQLEALVRAREGNEGVPRLGPVVLSWNGGGEVVKVCGSWDGWARPLFMDPAPTGGFRLLLVLPPGQYECKFVVDEKWMTSDDLERTECSNKNNIVYANDIALAPSVAPVDDPTALILAH